MSFILTLVILFPFCKSRMGALLALLNLFGQDSVMLVQTLQGFYMLPTAQLYEMKRGWQEHSLVPQPAFSAAVWDVPDNYQSTAMYGSPIRANRGKNATTMIKHSHFSMHWQLHSFLTLLLTFLTLILLSSLAFWHSLFQSHERHDCSGQGWQDFAEQ